jgi:hypothetical protein
MIHSFVFVNAIDRGRKLVRDFGISDMFPSMIAFDGSRSQYSLLRTAFDDSSVCILYPSNSHVYNSYHLKELHL